MSNVVEQFREQVVEWNKKFPLDYWWRKKHNVAFGSAEHRAANLFDMRFEYEEDKLMRIAKIAKARKVSIEQILDLLQQKIEDIHSTNIDKEFDELDITQFNDK